MAKSRGVRPTLDEISIRGLGVIDSAAVSFSPGFTAITGETGAGKTMVLTALGLITGAKADSDFVRTNAERSIVSAAFTVTPEISEKVLDAGGDVDVSTLTISRSVSSEGKSRINLGGSLSTAAKVSEISASLIEIHGQSSSLRLGKPSVQREIVDAFGSLSATLAEYERAFTDYNELSSRIQRLKKESASRLDQISSIQAFVKDFASIAPVSGEIVGIENEINRLGSVEEINSQLSLALNILESDDGGTLQNLKSAKKALDALAQKDSTLDEHIDRFSELMYGVEDVVSDLISYIAKLEADPQRFDYLQQRKQSINALIKKYGVGSDRLVAFEQLIQDYSQAEEKLSDLDGGADRIAQLENELSQLFSTMKDKGEALGDSRLRAAQELGDLITAELSALSMPNASVVVTVERLNSDLLSSYSAHGIDEVIFQFSPHTGSKLMSLAKIASGGEMSRLMLAIEVVIAAKSPVGTYVFDEVDAGVGGKAAVEVGRRLALLSRSAQVIVVTHLPQVAVWADNHLVVRKDQSGSITESSVTSLAKNERLKEIARMLAGQEESETAQKHAEELLDMVEQSVIS